MTKKMALHTGMKVVMMGVLCCIMVSCGAKAQKYEEVVDITGSFVHFGTDYPFYLITEDGEESPTLYHFGNGYDGDPVHTDTEITMGLRQDDTRIVACIDGNVTLVDDTGTTPQNALVKVRRISNSNSSDDSSILYNIDITEAPDIGVQLSNGTLRCQSGPGTTFQFNNYHTFVTRIMQVTS